MSEENVPNMDTLAKVYIKIRTAKQEITKEYEEKIAGLDEKLKAVAFAMKDQLAATGGTSIKTPHGTVYMVQKTRYYALDRVAFGEWVIENKAIDLLENRISQGNMKQYLEDNPTNPPPGLQADSETTVTVRKS